MDPDERLAAAVGGVARFLADGAGLANEVILELQSSVLSVCHHCFGLHLSGTPCEVAFHRFADRIEMELFLPAEEAPADKGHLAWPGVDEVHCETRGATAVLRLTKFVIPSPDAE
jgi:hypothetical protein